MSNYQLVGIKIRVWQTNRGGVWHWILTGALGEAIKNPTEKCSGSRDTKREAYDQAVETKKKIIALQPPPKPLKEKNNYRWGRHYIIGNGKPLPPLPKSESSE